jgi:sugar phosphate isomerase/epimerase
VRVGLETGQESPDELLGLLDELAREDIGVNFDPANMILYDSGDPVPSLERLAPHVVQIHLKDADPPTTPGQWGTERPLGEGSVDWEGFFRVVEARLGGVDLLLERESGESRAGDLRAGARLARRRLPTLV